MARYCQLFILSLMIAMGGQSLQAADPPNFSGTWTVDLNAPQSTPMEAMLEAQGATWIERKAVDSLSVTQVITQSKNTLTIKADTPMGARTQILYLDGRKQFQDTERMGKVELRNYWDKDGTAIVTVSKYATRNGQKAEWISRRYLQNNGRTMIIDHELTFDDGRKVTATRVLKKQ
jgi:hypothetical protein